MPDRYGETTPEPRVFVRPKVNALTVRCSWCKAGVGARCVVAGTNLVLQRSSFHEARVRAAELAATGALTRGRMS
ncbi:hypothetical protein PBI_BUZZLYSEYEAR_82 [Mycobacterium phage BuzzLyseyear]|uniref:DNA-binding phage zinc finger domain-containing protein n=7 Tax=Cheoctovirus TaxID=1623281 RepID=A0A386KRB6_9CAUD|nr:hypothetical protein BOOMER_77 [Mycobacterium phage Boomer]YP_009125075.1 hypothetical protein PBI_BUZZLYSEYEAR_82 [Mycobacterium phage BuzzLyseyear]YP_009956108.1 hypothetical protein I5H28_gp079 [Mycobacterium phage Donkeykong]YP_009957478.1 hypothetical protein I5H41_gp075 [Mycobacterium phage Galactic]YP_009959742.1 hypothetical protein I5H63_gp076 [Mycobacterium phage MilleniumForce]YP_009960972.1 hypothetical protein I5H75_gp078 [Mycobacterium phage OwlsT2W]YP_655831.1 gp70 [Mycobact